MKRFGFLRTFNQLITKRDAYHLETRVIKPTTKEKTLHIFTSVYQNGIADHLYQTQSSTANRSTKYDKKKRVQLWDISGTAYQSVITLSVAAKNCNNFSHFPQYRAAEESIPKTIPKCLKCNMDNLRKYKGTGCRIPAWR